jgi:hypothetical protein
MRPLTKKDWVNMPLSMPIEWRDFFDDMAAQLGYTRNAMLCQALRFGGPILAKYTEVFKRGLKAECERIERMAGKEPKTFSEILAPAQAKNPVQDESNERRQQGAGKESGKGASGPTGRRGGSTEPGRGQKGR